LEDEVETGDDEAFRGPENQHVFGLGALPGQVLDLFVGLVAESSAALPATGPSPGEKVLVLEVVIGADLGRKKGEGASALEQESLGRKGEGLEGPLGEAGKGLESLGEDLGVVIVGPFGVGLGVGLGEDLGEGLGAREVVAGHILVLPLGLGCKRKGIRIPFGVLGREGVRNGGEGLEIYDRTIRVLETLRGHLL